MPSPARPGPPTGGATPPRPRWADRPRRPGPVGGGGGVQELGSRLRRPDVPGRLTGLVASALLLVQVFLMARVSGRAGLGSGRTRPHAPAGRLHVVQPLMVHIGLITLGYAAGSLAGGGTSTSSSTTAGCCSPSRARRSSWSSSRRSGGRRLRYESWHLMHLYGYLGAGLPAAPAVDGRRLHDLTAASLLVGPAMASPGPALFRVLRCGARSAPTDGAEVREGPSVTVGGRGLADAGARRSVPSVGSSTARVTRANPYSISAAPDADLRSRRPRRGRTPARHAAPWHRVSSKVRTAGST